MNDRKRQGLIKQTGAVSLAIIALMTFLAVSLPAATKLVQNNQENRSQAVLVQETDGGGGGSVSTCSSSKCGGCTTSSSCYGATGCTWAGGVCIKRVITPPTSISTVKSTPKPQTLPKCSSKSGGFCAKSCSNGFYYNKGNSDCGVVSYCCKPKPTKTPTPTIKSTPKTCSYSGTTYAIGRAICQGNTPAECLSTGKWKLYPQACPYGCSGNGVCKSAPTPVRECEPLNKTKCETSATQACVCKAYKWQCTSCTYGCLDGTCKSAPAPTNTPTPTKTPTPTPTTTPTQTPTPTPKLTKCTTQGGTCTSLNIATCRSEGGSVISKTDCPANQICCKFTQTPTTNLTASTKPSCKDKEGICVHNLFTCGDKYSGKVIEGTDCVSVCCENTVSRVSTTLSNTLVTKIITDPQVLTIETGKSQKIITTVVPATATKKDLSWSVSGALYALVDMNGNVKALKPGVATVFVTAVDESKTKTSITVNVVDILDKIPSVIKSCADQKGICLPMGECRADNGSSIGKLDCTGTNVCCQPTLNKTEEITCVYNKVNYSKGKYICQGNNYAQARCGENGKWQVKVCPYLCNPDTGECNPDQGCKAYEYKCDGRNLMICKADGLGWELKRECGIDQTCNVTNKTCVSRSENCNPKEDNNKDGVVNSIDAALCGSKDGVCHPDYHLKTLKDPPSDSKACLKGSVSWINKVGKDGKYVWNCISLSDGLNDYCSANVEKGTFGGECNKDEDCQVSGLSRCVDHRCMAPGGCVSTRIDSTTRSWKGDICVNNKQHTCNNIGNNSNQDFWNFSTKDCPLGCDRNGIKCLSDGWKCSQAKNFLGGSMGWSSEYYQDNKKVDSIKCEFGCDQTIGRCNIDPKSTSKNPICDAAGGTCFGNNNTCQAEGGTVVNKTDCTSPQVCCKVGEEKRGCVSTQNRKYYNGQSACVQDPNLDIEGATPGDWMIKCENGSLTQTLCDNGCQNGLCLKSKNQTCKFNFECESKICGSEGMCLLKPEGGLCESDSECQSGNCPFGICFKSEAECNLSWKKGIDWFWGCQQGQNCNQGKCVTDGVCGVANNKDGRTFATPPTEADNLCKYGKPTTVQTLNNGNYTWQCLGDNNKNGKTANCSANKGGSVACQNGLKIGQQKCLDKYTLEICSEDDEEIRDCSVQSRGMAYNSFCIDDGCRNVSKIPTKVGDYCDVEGWYSCPKNLYCLGNKCISQEDKNKLDELEKLKPPCLETIYDATLASGKIYFCKNENESCNLMTGKCEPAPVIRNTKKAGERCNSNLECVKGYCKPIGDQIGGHEGSYTICSQYTQQEEIDEGSKRTLIAAAIVSAPIVIAAAPAVISSFGSWAMTNMTVMAAKFPALAALIAGADSVADAGEILYGTYMCGENPNSPECLRAMALAQIPGYFASVYSQIKDYAGGLGNTVIRSLTSDTTTTGLRLAGDLGESRFGSNRLWREVTEVTAGDAGKVGDESENIVYKFEPDPNLGKAGYLPGEITYVGGVPIQGPSSYDIYDEYNQKYYLGFSEESNLRTLEWKIAGKYPISTDTSKYSNMQKYWGFNTGMELDLENSENLATVMDYIAVEQALISSKYSIPSSTELAYSSPLNHKVLSELIFPEATIIDSEMDLNQFTVYSSKVNKYLTAKDYFGQGNAVGFVANAHPGVIFVNPKYSQDLTTIDHERLHLLQSKLGYSLSESKEFEAYLYADYLDYYIDNLNKYPYLYKKFTIEDFLINAMGSVENHYNPSIPLYLTK